MQVNTSAGRPPRIDRYWFLARYASNFPDLTSDDYAELLNSAIEDVYTLFDGVSTLWSHLERNAYCDKTRLCYGLLVAWYLTDLYPDLASGVASSGGIPIKSKKIGGTSVTFADSTKAGSKANADLLSGLRSNAFGNKAYLMIKSSGKINLYVGR